MAQLLGLFNVALSAAPSNEPAMPVPTTVVVIPASGVSVTDLNRLLPESTMYAKSPEGLTQTPSGALKAADVPTAESEKFATPDPASTLTTPPAAADSMRTL